MHAAAVRHNPVVNARRGAAAGGSAARGFTLIEILVVVVILGIAAAIVVPAIGSRSDLKATSAARMLMADLIYAQNRSIAQQKTHYVRFDKTTESYEVLEEISPATVITHPVELGPFIVVLGPNGPSSSIKDVEIDEVGFDGKSILAFDELGTPYAYDAATKAKSPMTAGSVRLKCKDFTMSVVVEPFSGELRIGTDPVVP
ncbi:MAG TPA: type II secretion system protein [Tepidisphaeraceae bacterium]|nr:type II secretion system protein [Tepidisphaeraceae bacterium]